MSKEVCDGAGDGECEVDPTDEVLRGVVRVVVAGAEVLLCVE